VRRLLPKTRRGKLLALLIALLPLTCAKALLTAPPGSSITCFANPPFIAANGDVSVISCLIVEPAGFPVPDGTVMQCFTTLGRIDPQGETKDGVARVNLVSDSRSGTASVTCVSGGPAAAPVTPTSTLPTTSTTTTLPASGGGGGSGTSNILQIPIGSARPALVKVIANPPRLASNRCTTVVATVYDESGNPVFNVPIIFSVSAPSEEFFQGGSSPIFTDTNGQVADVMCTRHSPDDLQTTVIVTATAPNGISGSYTVTIN
jgi:hypothetical protein